MSGEFHVLLPEGREVPFSDEEAESRAAAATAAERGLPLLVILRERHLTVDLAEGAWPSASDFRCPQWVELADSALFVRRDGTGRDLKA